MNSYLKSSLFCVFFLTVAVLTPVLAVAGEDPWNCQPELVSRIDISKDISLSALNESELPYLFKNWQSYVFENQTTSESLTVRLRVLNGLRNTGVALFRGSEFSGWLGRGRYGRYVVLQPLEADPAKQERQIWSAHHLNRLAKTGLALPVWGSTKINQNWFFVRPLVTGPSPFAKLYSRGAFATAQQLLDLEDIGRQIEPWFPLFVRGSILPSVSANLFDVEAQASHVTPVWADALNAFVPFSGFIAAKHSGRLLIEHFPPPSAPSTTFRSIPMRSDFSWYLDRWNWFRYMLLLQTTESEKEKYVTHVESHKKFVEIMFQTDQISQFLRLSPQFIIPWFEGEQGALAFITDQARPFTRPTLLQFKNKSKLNYHWQKHGSEFATTDPSQYLISAQQFISAPPSETREYLVRANGDILLVDLQTDVVAVFSPQGLIRTYMKPSVGFHGHSLNLFYYLEMALKEEGFF